MSQNPDSFTPVPGSVEGLDPRETRPAPSGTRRTSEAPIAEPWRDVLLRLSNSLPIDVSFEDLGRIFLDGVSLLFPGASLGICLVQAGRPEPVVLYRLGAGLRRGPERDPSRLFPTYAEERIYELDDGSGTSGSSFHVGRSAGTEPLSPLRREIAAQAATVLGAALGRLRVYGRAEESVRNFHRLQAQVIQTEKLASLGQIVAGVVHELNNPLTSIIAYSDYLTKKLSRGDSADWVDDAERVRRIGEAAERILKFTRDLVAYARPTGDSRGPVRVEEVIERALLFCEHEFEGDNVEVEQDFAEPLPVIAGITGQLTQVFVNLFTNAAHAMSERGGVLRIAVRSVDSGESLRIDVSDTGSGIPAEAMPQIFEPFFTTKTDGRGTGLGLSIVRGILDAHGGTIQVSSAIGEGTSFTLTLPIG
ncbi:MAG: GHKL domain-containing protein [Myxococcales bacterium]|nr:MAG: GHKL domain-containing protein [Myxococcales bacterium]